MANGGRTVWDTGGGCDRRRSQLNGNPAVDAAIAARDGQPDVGPSPGTLDERSRRGVQPHARRRVAS